MVASRAAWHGNLALCRKELQTVKRIWSLFYKFDGETPREFHEVRLFGTTVWSAAGRVQTWGVDQSAEFGNAEAAEANYLEQCRQIVAGGFQLAREGQFDASRFDFGQLTAEIREGARKAFSAIRAAHPGQTINSFSLSSDDGAMTIVHAANSKEALREAGGSDDYVWNPDEWPFCEGGEFLDVAYRMILPFHRGIPCDIGFDAFRSGVFESCIGALEQLDDEGFFGTGEGRKDVVLLFGAGDAGAEERAVERLNSVETLVRYRKWASTGK